MYLVKLNETYYRFDSFISVEIKENTVLLHFPDNKAATITRQEWEQITQNQFTVINALS